MFRFPEMNLRILKVLGDFIESFQDLPNYIFIAPLFLGLGGWRHLSMKNEMGSLRIRCQRVSGRAHTLRQEHEHASHMFRQWVRLRLFGCSSNEHATGLEPASWAAETICTLDGLESARRSWSMHTQVTSVRLMYFLLELQNHMFFLFPLSELRRIPIFLGFSF